MRPAAIEIDDLRKTYRSSGRQPAKEALKGVSLDIPQGSIFGLLGPNGAGKSTLINILAGLVTKTAGHVRIWGFDQDENPRQSRAAIGVMPQELNMDPFFTPYQSLEVQAGLYGLAKSDRRSMEILEFVGLADKANAYARNLSGGMRRRLLLAKALVHSPQILVLDEPTAGVDIELRQMLWRNVRRLNRERGTTIILTTHYLEEAQEMCDEIAIIDKGALIARDNTESLVGSIDQKTMIITPETPLPTELLVPDGVKICRRASGQVALTYTRAEASADDLLTAVHNSGVRIRDVAIEEANLEDVFLRLTHGS